MLVVVVVVVFLMLLGLVMFRGLGGDITRARVLSINWSPSVKQCSAVPTSAQGGASWLVATKC